MQPLRDKLLRHFAALRAMSLKVSGCSHLDRVRNAALFFVQSLHALLTGNTCLVVLSRFMGHYQELSRYVKEHSYQDYRLQPLTLKIYNGGDRAVELHQR